MARELGKRLQGLRTEANLSIGELSARTRIAARHIQALEDGRLDLLPGPFFVKGFIRSICIELGRNPDPLLVTVSALQEEQGEEENGPNNSGSRKIFPLVLTGAVLLALVMGGIWLHDSGKGKTQPVVQSVVPAASQEAAPQPESVPVQGALSGIPVEELNLVVRAIEKTWLRIQTDSGDPWETTLKTGDEIRLKGSERISLFIGNAGGILFDLNGKRFGPPGSSGQVISSYVITKDNL